MAGTPAGRPPSALVLFVRKNWKWLIAVIVVAALVMMVATD